MEIKDLAGLSGPLTKLVEVIASGVGGVSRPFLTRKNADAKAYEIRKIAEAFNDSRQLLGTVSYENEGLSIATGNQTEIVTPERTIEDRIRDRIAFQEIKKQINLEQISQHAAEEMRDKEQVSEEKVDEDWISRFFKIAEDISSEEMQVLWGKVLAGEVSKPRSYSLRTIETLKNLTKSDAQLFAKVAQAAMWCNGKSLILNPDQNCEYIETEFGITFVNVLRLKELGLILPSSLSFTLTATGEQKTQTVFIYGDTCILVERDSGVPAQPLTIDAYSDIGQELLPLINVKAKVNYIRKLSSLLKREGVVVRYAEILSREGDNLKHGVLSEALPIQGESKQAVEADRNDVVSHPST